MGNMENMSQSAFLIKRALEGVSIWTFSLSDIFYNFSSLWYINAYDDLGKFWKWVFLVFFSIFFR